MTEEEVFVPMGGEVQLVNNDPNHNEFTGKEPDGETGLDYFGTQYYEIWPGRFLTPDWAAKATAAPYSGLSDSQLP
jgi:RHS repeat-associated protein